MVRKVKIPKRIGSVELPKKVRKKAKKAINAAASPFVRDFAAAAMAAAGRARHDRAQGGEDGSSDRKEFRMCGHTRIDIDGAKVAEAFRAAAIDGLRRFLEGLDEGLRKAQAEKDGARPDPRPEPQARAKPKAETKPKAAKPKPAAKPRKPRKPRASGSSPGAAPA